MRGLAPPLLHRCRARLAHVQIQAVPWPGVPWREAAMTGVGVGASYVEGVFKMTDGDSLTPHDFLAYVRGFPPPLSLLALQAAQRK